jgi:thymidylate synthase ThyX
VNAQGNRLTTFQLRYPKFIHGEFMTHRVFSRNASSSRAIPTAKLIEEVRSDALRAAPVFWGKNQPGMQAVDELDPLSMEGMQARAVWKDAALFAAESAEHMAKYGAHKQIVNRLLEPFSHVNVVVTATEYANFFGLRLDRATQPEMRALAEAMWRCYQDHQPTRRDPGEWHLPFYYTIQDEQLFRRSLSGDKFDHDHHVDLCRKVSVARCARVSYLSFDTGKRSTVAEDLALYDRLIEASPAHLSPAEHQATPDTGIFSTDEGLRDLSMEIPERWNNWHQHGNFKGWRQFRKMIAGEDVAPLPKEYA